MGEAYAISFDLIMSNQFNNQFHETHEEIQQRKAASG
jgi:hypothetical protein